MIYMHIHKICIPSMCIHVHVHVYTYMLYTCTCTYMYKPYIHVCYQNCMCFTVCVLKQYSVSGKHCSPKTAKNATCTKHVQNSVQYLRLSLDVANSWCSHNNYDHLAVRHLLCALRALENPFGLNF